MRHLVKNIPLNIFEDTHTHTTANKQTSSTTPAPDVRFLVSWTVKQDRACSTPTGAFLWEQARRTDLDLQG